MSELFNFAFVVIPDKRPHWTDAIVYRATGCSRVATGDWGITPRGAASKSRERPGSTKA
jgi:hypothetical protein